MRKEELIRSLRERKFSPRIVRAFELVDRQKFVPGESAEESYEDVALSIGHEQTISQPYTIAYMLTLLEVDDNQKILEVGSGSGYVLDLLSRINPNGKIFGVERIKYLASRSTRLLIDRKNVKVIHGDGTKGLEIEAPFDRILVSGEFRYLPQNLLDQLKFKGILVSPVDGSLVVVKKESGMNRVNRHPGFSFVPIVEGTE
jgi:protein-L-isoaspartate(D-aspartate) O-methyltransferase